MRRTRFKWMLRLYGCACLLFLTGCASSNTASDVQHEGRALYEHYCASCHGVNGEGQPEWEQTDENGIRPAPPHDDTGHTWHHTDAQLLLVISEGRNAMPPFREILTPAQQGIILDYIKSFWSPEIRAAQEGIN